MHRKTDVLSKVKSGDKLVKQIHCFFAGKYKKAISERSSPFSEKKKQVPDLRHAYFFGNGTFL